MPNGEQLPQRLKSRGVSLPTAYYTDGSGKTIPVLAIDLQDEVDRKVISPLSDGKTFHCPVCKGKVYFRLGDIVEPANATLLNVPKRKAPRFQHTPGTAILHRQIETAEMAKDIIHLLIQFADKQKDWNPRNLEDWKAKEIDDLANGVWGVVLTREDPEYPGSPLRTTFIVALDPTKLDPKYDDAILITTSTGQGADKKRLTLYDSSYKPLTPSKLKRFIAENRVDSLHVSGYYARDKSPNKGEANEHYLPKQLKILNAVKSIVECSRVFVEGVNRVSSRKIQTGAIYGLFDSIERDNVQNLVADSPRKFTREFIAESLAKKFSLSVTYDSSSVKDTDRYKFGKAAILFVPGGNLKVLINPSPTLLMRKLEPSDWDNTMVIFVNQNQRREGFVNSSQIVLLRSKNPGINIQIRGVYSIGYAEREAGKFLETDIVARDLETSEARALDPAEVVDAFDASTSSPVSWEDHRSTLAFEAGNRM